MKVEEINDLMDELGVKNSFATNWTIYHGLPLENFGEYFGNVSRKEFIMHFNDLGYSFYWATTDEGDDFWNCKYYQLIYENLPKDIRLAKQAILNMMKKGYRLDTNHLCYQKSKSMYSKLTTPQTYAAAVVGNLFDESYDDKAMVNLCMTRMIENGYLKRNKTKIIKHEDRRDKENDGRGWCRG